MVPIKRNEKNRRRNRNSRQLVTPRSPRDTAYMSGGATTDGRTDTFTTFFHAYPRARRLCAILQARPQYCAV